ncbi:L-2-hydroxyglutarate oxidase [Leifsonia sp. F6_8S_P_1B]|uniref:L-2-hydroxyglutarate oxidase n=1 Tax=Leifsonia williamsii TaxID=3035919 RepID=A0ABT8K6S8_9MICO|nr:L-2-hydroxyglutarate oxidase [Leifsonia williamsii]MDN4612882.1 L-2-hydroxyglutarate oxidase [Leifsonia williamsii]
MSRSIVIVGGGILGLAVAARAARAGVAVTLLEKESRWAGHQTGHNSGVVHAGPYYKPGSLKARMCAAGNASMLAFAREHGIPHAVPGKLIVAVEDRELAGLDELHRRAVANGVPCRLIDADEASDYEPEVYALRALRVESTGIIDYPAVCRVLAELAQEAGAELLTGAEVTAIRSTPDGVVVEHTRGAARADGLVNCAGLHADRIARLAGVEPEVRIVPFRGEYYELRPERRDLVRGLIYPVPDPELPFLGVHLTRMIDGSVHAGPNAVLALAREGYRWRDVRLRDAAEALTYPGFLRMASRNLGTGAREVARSLSRNAFARSLARLVPAIESADIVRAGSGVRAQAVRPDGALADDFVIQHAPHQLHVLNAPSPAATSALEIAKHLVAEAIPV